MARNYLHCSWDENETLINLSTGDRLRSSIYMGRTHSLHVLLAQTQPTPTDPTVCFNNNFWQDLAMLHFPTIDSM